MKSVSYEVWGWINHDGAIQPDTFKTADAAINGMLARGAGESMQKIEELGFRLARLKLTLEVSATMEPVK